MPGPKSNPLQLYMDVMNRFKGFDLTDRVPEVLWKMVQNIVQDAVIKTIPKKNKWKKAKWFSEEVLQIVEKRRGVKCMLLLLLLSRFSRV